MTPIAFRYGTHRAQTGTLFLPDRPRPPVVCLFHGGFWTMPHGAGQMQALAEDLARRGYAACNLEYRRLGDGGGHPGTFDDAIAGIAHLARLERDDVALDLARVAAVGHSAGGHLALWAASQPQLALVAACGQAPIADLAAAHRLGLGHDVVARLLGGTPDELPERYLAASPALRTRPSVRRLIVHGEDDDVVPIAMSRAFADAAERTTLRAIPGCGHFEHLDPASAAWLAVIEWLRDPRTRCRTAGQCA